MARTANFAVQVEFLHCLSSKKLIDKSNKIWSFDSWWGSWRLSSYISFVEQVKWRFGWKLEASMRFRDSHVSKANCIIGSKSPEQRRSKSRESNKMRCHLSSRLAGFWLPIMTGFPFCGSEKFELLHYHHNHNQEASGGSLNSRFECLQRASMAFSSESTRLREVSNWRQSCQVRRSDSHWSLQQVESCKLHYRLPNVWRIAAR